MTGQRRNWSQLPHPIRINPPRTAHHHFLPSLHDRTGKLSLRLAASMRARAIPPSFEAHMSQL